MKTSFDFLPDGYRTRRMVTARLLGRYGAAAAVLLCAVVFSACLMALAPRLRREAVRSTAAKNKAFADRERLEKLYAELRGEAQYWERLTDAAERSVPVLHLLTKLKMALPETAQIESFSADEEAVRLSVRLEDATIVPRLLRQLDGLPYGPFSVRQRTSSRKSASVALEARRRR